MNNSLTITLAGQPNCGKSTIFNMLTGANQHVANYPGVTVEKLYGSFSHKNTAVKVVDLPGTYSLTSYSPEELVTRKVLLDEHPDLVLTVVDASTLDKSMYLLLQILEMEQKVVVVLNMIDVAEKRKISIDDKKLSEILGLPVIPLSATKAIGKGALLDQIINIDKAPISKSIVDYGVLEPYIEKVATLFVDNRVPYPLRWLAIKLLENDEHVVNFVSSLENGQDILDAMLVIKKEVVSKEKIHLGRFMAVCRHNTARALAKTAVTCEEKNQVSLTDKIDVVVCHRIFGPIFLFLVLFLFYHTSVTLGNYLASKGWVLWTEVEGLAEWILPSQHFLHDSLLTSLGMWVVKSVTAVLNYLPIFLIMFALVAILEDSGYLARIAFVLDRIFRSFGLHGQSTLPLILGGVYVGGCAIPGVMATKAIPDERARFATILIIPMMNCLAKVPLYLLLVSVFFPGTAGSTMFFMGTITLFMGMITAKILSLTLLRGKPSAPFIIELPIYHMPTIKNVVLQTMQRIWLFFKKISTVIVAVSVCIFMLISFPNLPEEREKSYDDRQNQAISKFLTAVQKTKFKDSFTNADVMPLILYQEELRSSKRGVTKEKAKKINAEALIAAPVYAAIVLRQGKEGKSLAKALKTLDRERKTMRREMRQERFEKSFIGSAGRALEPITAGAGFSWRRNVALLSALAAKENSAATLGAIYGIDGSSIGDSIKQVEAGFTPLHALALMLFMALYPPCLPAAMMIRVQTGSTKWMLFSIFFQIFIGLAVATLVFTGGNMLGFTGTQAMWAFYCLCLAVLFLLAFIKQKEPASHEQRSFGQP